MARGVTFSEVVEMTNALNLEEKETLLEVLRHRTVQERRKRLAKEARGAWKEYRKGKYKAMSAAEIMAEIMR